MSAARRTPREEIERAFHVSFKLPEQAAALLDAYRDQVLAEARAELDARRATSPCWMASEGVGHCAEEEGE